MACWAYPLPFTSPLCTVKALERGPFVFAPEKHFSDATVYCQVPLPSASVDVVVFCLSLMGTNMMDFIQEARRLLVDNGIIKVCMP